MKINAVILPLLRGRYQSLEDSRSTGEVEKCHQWEPAAICKSDRKEGNDKSIRKKGHISEKLDKANERFAHGQLTIIITLVLLFQLAVTKEYLVFTVSVHSTNTK